MNNLNSQFYMARRLSLMCLLLLMHNLRGIIEYMSQLKVYKENYRLYIERKMNTKHSLLTYISNKSYLHCQHNIQLGID